MFRIASPAPVLGSSIGVSGVGGTTTSSQSAGLRECSEESNSPSLIVNGYFLPSSRQTVSSPGFGTSTVASSQSSGLPGTLGASTQTVFLIVPALYSGTFALMVKSMCSLIFSSGIV